jgi:hypothetical protein
MGECLSQRNDANGIVGWLCEYNNDNATLLQPDANPSIFTVVISFVWVNQ